MTGSLHSYWTQLVWLSNVGSAHSAYRAWVRSNEFKGLNPSFKAEILFSLALTWLVGTATRAMLRGLWEPCANVLDVDSMPRRAEPPAPTKKSLRLGSSFSGSAVWLSEVSDLFFLFICDIHPSEAFGSFNVIPRK